MRYVIFCFLLFVTVSCDCRTYDEARYGMPEWTTRHGLIVATNGFPIDKLMVEDMTARTLGRWREAFAAEGWACQPSVNGMHVTYQPHPIPYYDGDAPADTAYGMTEFLADVTVVTVAVDSTDNFCGGLLGHELGHAILQRCGYRADEAALIGWWQKYGVPYAWCD